MVGIIVDDEQNSRYNDVLNKLTSAIIELEKQDKELFDFDPAPLFEFGALYPDAVKNMLENREMLRSESCEREHEAIINCKSTPEERLRNFKKLIG